MLDDLVAQARPLISRGEDERLVGECTQRHPRLARQDRKSTRLNSSHTVISYAVFCLKKKMTRPRTSRNHAVVPARRPRAQRTISRLFFFNDTATTEIYTLSLHDALPILPRLARDGGQIATVGRPPIVLPLGRGIGG